MSNECSKTSCLASITSTRLLKEENLHILTSNIEVSIYIETTFRKGRNNFYLNKRTYSFRLMFITEVNQTLCIFLSLDHPSSVQKKDFRCRKQQPLFGIGTLFIPYVSREYFCPLMKWIKISTHERYFLIPTFPDSFLHGCISHHLDEYLSMSLK